MKILTLLFTLVIFSFSGRSYAAAYSQPQEYLAIEQASDLTNAQIDTAPIINRMIHLGVLNVHLPCGTYLVKSQITLINNVSLLGDGSCTILSVQNENGETIFGNSTSFTSLKNMTIRADTQRHSGGAISLKNSFESTIRDIAFTNGSGKHFTDIYLDGSNSTHIDHISGRGAIWNGITVTGSDKRSEDTYIANSNFDGYGGSPIELAWSSGNYLSQLDLLGGINAGIMIDPRGPQEVDGLRASSVLADSNYGPGWRFDGNGTITETALTNCWGSTNGISGGISAGLVIVNTRVSDLVINASEFHANTGAGLDISAGQHIQISNNTVLMNSKNSFNGSPGINIGENTNFVIVTGNITGAGGEAQNGALKSQQTYGITSFVNTNDAQHFAVFSNNLATGNQQGGFHIPTSTNTPNITSLNNIGY